uniref:WD repeat-containing protein 76 n=1 Tax=Echeneis naucrates TaxID=173247 RepID=A0A665U3U1_ECHNA
TQVDAQIKEEDAESSDVEPTSNGHGGLSAYELERLENIRQNQAFLSSINLLQVGTSLAVNSTPAIKKCAGPLPMDPVNMEEGGKLPSQLLQLCSEVGATYLVSGCRYQSNLKNMRITEDKVAKVVKDRILSATFHPCNSSLLMAAGDKWGRVGLWNLDGGWGDDGVLLFHPHTRSVGCLAFSRAQPTQLLTLSYDGSLRCMDVEKTVFDDVYDIEDGLKTFDFMSHDCSTLVVGNWFGEVAIVDRHEQSRLLMIYLLTCRTESKYDGLFRCLKKTNSQPVSQLHGHSLSIFGAYFSPCTGNRLLTSCMDNCIRVYDTSAMTTQSPLLTKIRYHHMQTGRWLSKLSAVWDPKQEDCFVVGSMTKPRRVQVFHESGQLQHSFMDEEKFNTVLSITAFHPTRNALLGGNASGRLHVFSD